MTPPAHTPYDSILYPDGVFPQTHPDRLHVIATLLGLSPAPVERARILDLGCGTGGNIVPLACQYPDSQCVGVDYAATQIAIGQSRVDALGLTNIRLLAEDFMTLDIASLGQFDYIIAHGIYSWVPPDVAARVLAITKACLSPNGVAYVSYNVLPGWTVHYMGRDLMRYRTRGITDPDERIRIAREVLALFAENGILDETDSHEFDSARAYFMALAGQSEYLATKADAFMFHDELETSGALYFSQFVEQAHAAGLDFLSEAYLPHSLSSNLPAPVQHGLAALTSDPLETEQYMDFLRGRAFRQSLLVHRDAPIDRALSPQRLTGLRFAANMQRRPVDANTQPGVARFVSSHNEGFSTADPFTAACFDLLAEAYPAACTLPELTHAARERAWPFGSPRSAAHDAGMFAGHALTAYSRSKSMIDIRASQVPGVSRPSQRPVASALARYQAAQSTTVTSQRHEPVTLDATTRALIQLLDGTRDIEALVEAMRGQVVIPAHTPEAQVRATLEHEIGLMLNTLAKSALLVG